MQKVKEYWSIAGKLCTSVPFARTWLALVLVSIPLRKKIFGRVPRPLSLSYNGRSFVLYVRDAADIAVLREVFVEGEYRLEARPRRVVDIGSHVGVSAIFFACTYPEARISAYEPDSDNYALLVKNTSQFPTVRCVPAAVSGRSGEVSFYKNKGSSIASSLVSRGGKEEVSRIQAVSLDDILSESRVDLLKFDVEGGEYDMFAASALHAQCPVYVGEMHYDLFPQSREEFLSLFPDHEPSERPVSAHRSIMRLTRPAQPPHA
jgi:FkbM family methyltransferase